MTSRTDSIVQALRTLNGIGIKAMRLEEFAVCSIPVLRGELSPEEYAPYLAAADLKHDTYMRHSFRRPMPAGALRNEVSVDGTLVAWLLYDGTPRVIDRAFSDPNMNRIRDLAREHLGQDPQTQQMLADERGDVEKMTVEGFEYVLWALRDRAKPGAEYNAFPEDMPVREWSAKRRAEERARTGKEFPYVPNPVAKYSDKQRAEWARKADEVEEPFRRRFPVEHRLWQFRQWWKSSRADRSQDQPIDVKVGDRLVFEEFSLHPVVVERTLRPGREGARVDLRRMPERPDDDGIKSWVVLYPSRAMRFEDVPEDIRRHWESTWAELEKRIGQ